jgi:hypothetical protein
LGRFAGSQYLSVVSNMSMHQIVLQGIVESDGTLKLDQPVPLPPGAVEVTIKQQFETATSLDPFWATMEEIWAGQRLRGHVPRSKAEIDAEIASLRDEAEKEMLAVERIHTECQQASIRRTGARRGRRDRFSGRQHRYLFRRAAPGLGR